jgi:hypothetical protein
MSPVALAILQALATLGPSAIQAIIAVINAGHGQPVSEADHAAIGRAVVQAIGKQAAD